MSGTDTVEIPMRNSQTHLKNILKTQKNKVEKCY